MKLGLIILAGVALLAGCGESSTNNASNRVSNSANSVVNAMNTNAANMPGTNNNTGYVMNSNQTSPPSMPRNATNISPPSTNTSVRNSNANSHTNKPNGKG
ncbi:MAG: hypothetical protein JO314_00335 [Acidobacteria bacterium]|nr:hypothetical protein [Acidobacteriota bacterium]